MRASGLDRPLVGQYFHYVGSALTGDLGRQLPQRANRSRLVLLERLPATLSLAFAAMVLAAGDRLPARGDLRGRAPARRSRTIVRVVSQLGVSVPDFWLGILFILLFAGTLGWLPPSGYVPLTEDPVGWLSHVILPGDGGGPGLRRDPDPLRPRAVLEVPRPRTTSAPPRPRGCGTAVVVLPARAAQRDGPRRHRGRRSSRRPARRGHRHRGGLRLARRSGG